MIVKGDKYQVVDVTGSDGAQLSSHRNTRGGGSGSECYTCGRMGHLDRDCELSNGGGSGRGSDDDECFTCGAPGNVARDCDRNSGGGGGGGGRGGCYNYGVAGHIARDCDRSSSGGTGGGGGCYTCGGYDQLARGCPSTGLIVLTRDCDRSSGAHGHLVRDSPGEGRRGGGGGGRKCYNCGEMGHFSRECTSPGVK